MSNTEIKILGYVDDAVVIVENEDNCSAWYSLSIILQKDLKWKLQYAKSRARAPRNTKEKIVEQV